MLLQFAHLLNKNVSFQQNSLSSFQKEITQNVQQNVNTIFPLIIFFKFQLLKKFKSFFCNITGFFNYIFPQIFNHSQLLLFRLPYQKIIKNSR